MPRADNHAGDPDRPQAHVGAAAQTGVGGPVSESSSLFASPSPRSRPPSCAVRAGADPPTPRVAPDEPQYGELRMSEVPEVPTFRLARREPRPDPCPRDPRGPETHVTHDALGASCPVSLGYTTDISPAARRSTRLRQYGGPRAGARAGASVDSPRPRRKRRTDAASLTSATRRMRPPQRGHARTSIAKHRLRSSAHGRYRDPARFAGFSASAVPSAATAGRGTILGLILLAGARTPA
jgi:hypothetical protein